MEATTTDATAATIEPDQLTEVRFRMYQQFPFWAILAERFGIHASDAVPTARVTDDANIYLNPGFWSSLSVPQRTFVMAHEVGHKAFDHFLRRRGRDGGLWNVAGDFALNSLLKEDMEDRAMPPYALHEADWKDLTAEAIYDLIEKDAPKSRCWTGDMLDGVPDDAVQVCGPREEPLRTGQEWKAAISSALVAARMRGRMPAGLERAVLRRLEAQVDWAIRLAHLLKQSLVNAGNKEQSWLPPSRRFIYQGWYFPRVNIGRRPRMAWAVDTSGSREPRHLARAHSEIDAARKLLDVDVYVVDCDAKVHSGRWVRPIDPLPVPRGGGGTDFRPVFDHVASERIDPDALVFFTDTWGEFPEAAPPYPVLWVVDVPDGQAPWGEMIRVKA